MRWLCWVLIYFNFAISFSIAETDGDEDTHRSSAELPDPIDHEIPPIIIPVIKNEKIIAYLRLSIKLITKDKVSFAPFKPFIPRLSDAYFTDIFSVMCDQWLPYKDPDPATVLTRLQKLTNSIIKSEEISVYITNFYFYRLPSDSSN